MAGKPKRSTAKDNPVLEVAGWFRGMALRGTLQQTGWEDTDSHSFDLIMTAATRVLARDPDDFTEAWLTMCQFIVPRVPKSSVPRAWHVARELEGLEDALRESIPN